MHNAKRALLVLVCTIGLSAIAADLAYTMRIREGAKRTDNR
jgi:hypothetical protein